MTDSVHEDQGGAFGGRYEVVELLGAGGMGEVYHARDRLGGDVALKRVKPLWKKAVEKNAAAREARDKAAAGAAAEARGGGIDAHVRWGMEHSDAYQIRAHVYGDSDDDTSHGDADTVARGGAPSPPTAFGYVPALADTSPSLNRALQEQQTRPLEGAEEGDQGASLVEDVTMASATRATPVPRLALPEEPSTTTRGGDGEGAQDAQDPSLSQAHDATGIRLSMLCLAREFRTLASLRHPHIVSVIDYGFDRNRIPFFTMDLYGNAQELSDACKERSPEERAELVVQVLQALEYLHRRGVLHRDLKPGNVLVIEGEVKVLDFGLSIPSDRVKEHSGRAEGTLAYMAPELFVGKPPSVASDLYAVGIMLYEMFAGRHPFSTKNLMALYRTVLEQTPDLTRLDARVAPLVGRLLAKAPEERPKSASQVMHQLREAMGLELEVEPEHIRDSLLQGARLVGREAELERLQMKLRRAGQGFGSVCLLAGESGVGKSRLLEEVRAQALVEGVVVLRGQAIREGGPPFQVWRNALRRLALEVELTELEASVFKLLVPDLPQVLGRAIPDPVETDAELTQTRLFGAVDDVFRRCTKPVLLILEDLHWAQEASLALLAQLASEVPERSVVVLGSYRDDERPELGERVEGEQLKLERLSDTAVAELAESIMGEAGRSAALQSFLKTHTEGNALFVVEVVRALAENVEALDQVRAEALPETILPRSVEAVLLRRLERVPEGGRDLLEVAAVLGRELDEALLQRVDAEVAWSAWLQSCTDAAVLEWVDDAWRFAHDKLRDAIIAQVSPERQRAIHAQAARGLEALYGGGAQVAPRLAWHWRHAGRPERELRYAALAGQFALEAGAYRQALELLERAEALSQRDGVPAPQGGWAQQRQRWGRLRSEAWYGLGDFDRMRDAADASLRCVDQGLPDTDKARKLTTLRELVAQVGHLLAPRLWVGRRSGEAEALMEQSHVEIMLARAAIFQQDQLGVVLHSLRATNAADAAGQVNAHAVAILGFVAATLGRHKLAERYFQRGRASHTNDTRGLVELLLMEGVYWLGMGELERSTEVLCEGLELALALGYRRAAAQLEQLLGCTTTHRGLFHEELFHRSNSVEHHRGDDHTLVDNARVAIALTYCALGRFDEAEAIFEEVLPKVREDNHLIRAILFGGLAKLRARQGHYSAAQEAAEQGMVYASQLSTLPPACHSAVYGPAEALIACWTAAEEVFDEDVEALEVSAREALKRLERFAKSWPIGRARMLVCRGQVAWLEGEHERARACWHESLEQAERLGGMPFEEGLALLELGRTMPIGTPMRAQHLKDALERFEGCDAQYFVRQTRALMRA